MSGDTQQTIHLYRMPDFAGITDQTRHRDFNKVLDAGTQSLSQQQAFCERSDFARLVA